MALEQRLRSADAADLMQRRQVVVFERFLARVAAVLGDAAIVKGGVVLELRLERARATRDVDLRVTGSIDHLRAHLPAIGTLDLGDFMTFELAPHAEHPTIENDGLAYEGLRFRATCRLADKLYGSPFGVDVVFGEPMWGKPDVVIAQDTLGFAGIAPPRVRIYPVETHLAEKLHAYTTVRARPNSRVKDLPDIALLASYRPLEATQLREALEHTFAARRMQVLPRAMPVPPSAWAVPYAAMADKDRLPWRTLDEVAAAARGFLDPILAGVTRARWVPGEWVWRG